MSSIAKCLDDKVKAGLLSRDKAEEALQLIKKYEAEYGRSMNQSAAEAAAAARAAEELTEAARRKKRDLALQTRAVKEAVDQAQNHPKGLYAGIAAVFARDWHNLFGNTSVEARIKTVQRDLYRHLGAMIETYRSRKLGLTQDQAGLANVVRALYGENVEDAAASAAAKAWSATTDYAADRFNAAGGHLAKRSDWRLPQRMEPARVKGQRDQWIAYMTEAWQAGRLKVRDFETGGSVSPLRLAEILDQAYERIASNGASDINPGVAGGTKLANARLEHRVFEWASADAWLDMNRKWGRGDGGIHATLMGHIEGMARDIAMLEKLGPNPDLTARYLIDLARKKGVGGLKVYNLEAIWEHLSGRVNQPVSANLANLAGGTRAWLTSAQLGSATISSVTDFQTLRQTATWNGLPQMRLMQRYVETLAGSKGSKALAARTGLIAEGAVHAIKASMRHEADAEIGGFTANGLLGSLSEAYAVSGAKAAEVVLRGSALTIHTDAARQAFGHEFLAFLADMADNGFDRLAPALQRSFGAYGITPDMWNAIRQGVETTEGVAFISPAKLEGIDARAGRQLMDMILTEMDYAVPTPGARERSWLFGKSRRGTFVGEFLRSAAQYKSFPVTMLTTSTMRQLQAVRRDGRWLWAIDSAIGVTLLGGLAVQMKQIGLGKDPRDMTDPRFLGAAFMQGGGAGIMGDFFYASLNRSQAGFWMTMTGGPTAKFVDDAIGLTGHNLQGIVADEDTNFGRELARFVRNYTPGSSLWYSRLAIDRLMWNRLQDMLDPRASGAFRRMEQRARKEYGQGYWWRPGVTNPERAPDLGAALGD